MAADPRTMLKQTILDALVKAKEAALLEEWSATKIHLQLAESCTKLLEAGNGAG